jgi:hypothetical protein
VLPTRLDQASSAAIAPAPSKMDDTRYPIHNSRQLRH